MHARRPRAAPSHAARTPGAGARGRTPRTPRTPRTHAPHATHARHARHATHATHAPRTPRTPGKHAARTPRTPRTSYAGARHARHGRVRPGSGPARIAVARLGSAGRTPWQHRVRRAVPLGHWQPTRTARVLPPSSVCAAPFHFTAGAPKRERQATGEIRLTLAGSSSVERRMPGARASGLARRDRAHGARATARTRNTCATRHRSARPTRTWFPPAHAPMLCAGVLLEVR